MRSTTFLALAVGIVLLAGSIGLGVRERSQKQLALDHALTNKVDEESTQLAEYFERARSIILLTSHNPAFANFYRAPGSRVAKVRAHGVAISSAEDALAYLEELYPASIGEACFIDRAGAENARYVQGTRAPFSELSPDESSNPFFKPTFALSPGGVYQAKPYVSPDTHEWVISNSTPLAGFGSRMPAIVHFEVTLESFRRQAAAVAGSFDVAIVDGNTGRIVVDSRSPQRLGTPLGRPDDSRFVDLVARGETVGTTTLNGHRGAFKHLHTQPGNANDWYVVATNPRPVGFLLSDVGWAPFGMAGASLALLILAGVSSRSARRALRHQAFHDGLTELPNRALFRDRIEQALLQAGRTGESIAVMLIDLDRFKEVNDTLGHHSGDALLQGIGGRIRAALRASDTVARLGGDEFGILAPNTDAAGALTLASKLDRQLAEPLTVAGVALEVEASIGIAVFPEHGEDVETLIQHSDIAMYLSKETHAPALYAPERDQYSSARLTLIGELRRALANDEIVLYYQPRANLGSSEVRSVEALARWQHPEHGLLTPDQFIPLAENTGLIRPLTRYVLDAALRQCRAWKDAGLQIGVAVNISGRDLLDLRLPDEVAELLNKWAIPPALLELEITENTVLTDPTRAHTVLTRLSELGINLAIDDFGSGHSSLGYLKRLPINVLKIDKSFVLGMVANDDDAVIVRSTIDLGHNLGLEVVAEGVESEELWKRLAELDCDTAQGYYLARPTPAETVTELLVGTAQAAARVT